MSYGDGADWAGDAPQPGEAVTVGWRLQWREVQDPFDVVTDGPVSFRVDPGDTAEDVAQKLATEWNSAPKGGAAAPDLADRTIVRFTRPEYTLIHMHVRVGEVPWLELKEGPCNGACRCNAVTVVGGLNVKNVL